MYRKEPIHWERKYLSLLETYREEYLQEISSFRAMDEKANKIFVILSVFIAGLIAMIGTIKLDDLFLYSNFAVYILVFVFLLLFICFVLAYKVIHSLLYVIKAKSIGRMVNFEDPDDSEFKDYFDKSDPNSFDCYLVKCYELAKLETASKNQEKLNAINMAFKNVMHFVLFSFFSLMLIPLLVNISIGYSKKNITEKKQDLGIYIIHEVTTKSFSFKGPKLIASKNEFFYDEIIIKDVNMTGNTSSDSSLTTTLAPGASDNAVPMPAPKIRLVTESYDSQNDIVVDSDAVKSQDR